MSSSNIVAEFKKIEIQINNEEKITADIELYLKKKSYFFIFNLKDYSIPGVNSNKIVAFIQQMDNIAFKQISINKTAVTFTFKDNNKFPTFYLPSFSARMLESYLINKDIIVATGDENVKNTFNKIPLQRDSMHSNLFIAHIKHENTVKKLLGRVSRERRAVTMDDINMLFDSEGRITDENKVMELVGKNKLEKTHEAILWPFILKVYPFDSTSEERTNINQENLKIYEKLGEISLTRKQKSRLNDKINSIEKLLENEKIDQTRKDIMIDVLTKYSILNKGLGYQITMESIVLVLFSVFIDEIVEEEQIVQMDNGVKFKKEQIVKMNNGVKFDIKQFSAFILSCLRGFLKNGNSLKFYENSFEHKNAFNKSVLNVLKIIEDEAYNWVSLFKLCSSDIVCKNVGCRFSNLIPKKDIAQIWDISLTSKSPDYFYIFISASLLLSFYGRKRNNVSWERNIEEEFIEEVKTFNVEEIIEQAESMMEMCKDNININDLPIEVNEKYELKFIKIL